MYYTAALIKSGYDISVLPDDIQRSIGQVLKAEPDNGTFEVLDREIILSIYASQPFDDRVANLVDLVNADESMENDGFNTRWAQHEAEIKYTSDEVDFSELEDHLLTDVVFDRKKYTLVKAHNWLAKNGYPSRLPKMTDDLIEFEFSNEAPDVKAKIGPGVIAYLKEKTDGIN